MREHNLRAPHRARPRFAAGHDRKIVSEAKDVTWTIYSPQISTVLDGKIWLFAVSGHWDGEALGWHVSKRRTRHGS